MTEENSLDQKLSKKELLSSEKDIEALFTKGKSIKCYPLVVKYNLIPGQHDSCNQILISVPKRSFKKAVDRNLIKRRIKEAYRLNKSLLDSPPDQKIFFHIAYIYVGKKVPTFDNIQIKLIESLERLSHMLSNDSENQP